MAILSKDGTMYLDLDHKDGVSSNGTHPDYANIQSSVEAPKSPMSPTDVKGSPENLLGPSLEETKTEQDISLVKKKIKPPMPPTKEARPSAMPEKTDPLLDKVCNVFFNSCNPSNFSVIAGHCSSWLAGFQLLSSSQSFN